MSTAPAFRLSSNSAQKSLGKKRVANSTKSAKKMPKDNTAKLATGICASAKKRMMVTMLTMVVPKAAAEMNCCGRGGGG